MPPLVIGLGISGLASGAAGVIGHLANASAQERAAILQEKGVQEWLKVNVPNPQQQKLVLDKFINVGELDPTVEQSLMAQDSEFKRIQTDPQLKQARMRSLASLEEQGYGGESLVDKAAQNKALIDSGAANRGRQQAITSDMERRGQLGSGLELVARLDSQQAEGDRLAEQSLDLESQRRQRALQAIEGAGDLAGDIQQDEYAMKSDAARAADAINLFNTQNAQGVLSRNAERDQAANLYNNQNAQDISNKNTTTANFQQQYNKELSQQEFDNKAKRAAGISGQYNNQAENERAAGKSAADMWGNIASGIGTVGQGVTGYMQGQDDKAAAIVKQKADQDFQERMWSQYGAQGYRGK